MQPPDVDHERLVLDRYRLGRCLGAGSFGTVWRAHDEHLDRDVAIKIVARARVLDERFAREARAAARLSHPAIVTVYEAAVDDDAAYLVSELIRGPTLDKLLDAGRLSDHDIVGIGVALCDGLDQAHAQGVIHRDVKPSNILIPARPVSGSHPAKLTDFGIAHVVGGDSLTKSGDVLGTEAYMAPEQAVGREVGPAADLYALALVLYEALTGVNPIAGVRRSARLGAHLPPLRRQRRDLPRELGRGIDLALRPRARERGTIGELRGALISALDELSDVRGIVEGPWRPSITRSQPEEEPRPVEHGPALAQSVAWPERGLASAGAALMAGWLGAHTLGAAAVAPATIALIAATLVLLLPRVGFLLVAMLLLGGSALAGHTGAALVVGAATLVPVALLPRDGTAWPLATGAPLLGVAGLAGAWPALGARAGGPWRRAAVAASGCIWLVFASSLSGSNLYFRPHGVPALSVWTSSPYDAIHHVLGSSLGAGVLLAAGVWAAAAVVLPWLVVRRSLALDAARVVAWAVMLVLGTEIALRVGSNAPSGAPHTALLGAVAAVAVALGPSFIDALGSRPRSEVTRAGLP